MRKISILLLLILCANSIYAQTNYVESEGEYTQKKVLTNNDFYTFTRYTHLFKNHHKLGWFAEVSSDANFTGYASGIVYSLESFNILSLEMSIGPEFDKEIRTKESEWGLLGNINFATKTDKERARWKTEGFCTIYHGHESGWWHQAQVVVSPFKWLSIGVRDQSYSLRCGGIIRINMPGGIKPFFGFDKNRQLIGLSISGKL